MTALIVALMAALFALAALFVAFLVGIWLLCACIEEPLLAIVIVLLVVWIV